eukprot:CAMPEP_0114239124 /NCGR_PEP_ID=MMETSP0058-20121206/8283_1 /TAXON_ID=36894 /ORGANISM="Pyramimonas parkeae, CCMP726" /LENGTH=231 /DNA_ID=CAMNT_0001351265 /DNA_START=1549 /DNA_END=2243 /DNA_ORIENTATION=-
MSICEAQVIPTDLALPGAAAELVKETQSRSLDISILVNNAGFSRAGDFLDVPFATLADVLVVNSQVCMELMRLYLPFMVARDRGHVMNVASVAAAIPGPGMAVYHATKSFLSSLGRGVNAELRGTGVSVTTVWPGSTATGLFEACNAPRAIIGCLPVMVQTSQDAASQAVRGTLAARVLCDLGYHSALQLAPGAHATAHAGRVRVLVDAILLERYALEPVSFGSANEQGGF